MTDIPELINSLREPYTQDQSRRVALEAKAADALFDQAIGLGTIAVNKLKGERELRGEIRRLENVIQDLLLEASEAI